MKLIQFAVVFSVAVFLWTRKPLYVSLLGGLGPGGYFPVGKLIAAILMIGEMGWLLH